MKQRETMLFVFEPGTCNLRTEPGTCEPGTWNIFADLRLSTFRPWTFLCSEIAAERSEINVWIPSEFGTEDNRIQNIPYVRLPAYTHECARTQVHV